MNTQNYAVNIRVGLANPARVNISQGDTGRTLAFSLYDGLSPFTPPTGSTVTIVGRKPSKLGFSEACTVSGNVATVTTTLAMTQEAGKFPVELRIEAGGQSIGTANFTMYVEPSPHPDGTTDGTHATVDNLQTQIGNLANLTTTAKTNLVSAINEAAQSGGTEVVIDNTLTQTGQAADAKKTGDEISAIKADLADVEPMVVTVTDGAKFGTCDKTYLEIFQAVNSGRTVVAIGKDGIPFPYVGVLVESNTPFLAFGISATYNQTATLTGYLIGEMSGVTVAVYQAQTTSFYSVSEIDSKFTLVNTSLSQANETIESIVNDDKNVVSWSHFRTETYPLGWRTGFYRGSDGSINTSSQAAMCLSAPSYIPSERVKEFTISVPSGKTVAVHKYNFDTGYQNTVGGTGSTSHYETITVKPDANCYYKFSVGYFSDGASNYINTAFLNNIVLTETYYAGKKDTGKHLNICLLGNSSVADSWAYVPFILKKYGITCNIHFYYRGGGSIYRLSQEWEDNTATGLDEFGKSHVRRYVHIDTRYHTRWEAVSSSYYSPKQVVEMVNDNPDFDKWDIILLHSGQPFASDPTNGDPRKGAEPAIRQVVDLIKASYDKPYHLVLSEGPTNRVAYEGDVSKGYPPITADEKDNRVGVLKSTEAIMSAEPFDMVIPIGASVFNARTNASLASTAVSATGNLWCSDKTHLHAGIPNYIANCAVLQSIFKKFYPELSILGDDTRITDALITKYNCPFITSWCGSVLDNTELLYELGQKAAVMACEHPYDITPIYSPTDTTQLEWLETHQNRYWADALIDTSNIV